MGKGGFITLQHNKVGILKAKWLTLSVVSTTFGVFSDSKVKLDKFWSSEAKKKHESIH